MKHSHSDRIISIGLGLAFGLTQLLSTTVVTPVAAGGLSQEFGIIGAVASLSGDGAKQTAVDKIADIGIGWNRQEITYADPVDFAPYDAAHSKLEAKGIKTLGLLTYPGADKSHDQWKTYVNSVVSHYSTIPAWEIMNEADNYLSGADYVTYLNEARDIIKGINGGATIVLSGITSRPETPNFWNAVAAAGGWGSFDVVGLHVYHAGNPEKVNFGGGDLLAEYDRAISSLSKNGGGKKIWITESGYKYSEGAENQANWIARMLNMSRSVSTIEKIFIYRLADNEYGLTDSGFGHHPAYDRVKSVVSNLGGRGIGARVYAQDKQTLDSLESTGGWLTKQSSNAAVNLSTAGGKSGNGMKIDYNFSADAAYAIAEKSIGVSGTPEAFAAWFYGDGTKNVWKFRFKDANGETFQTDLGNISAGWNYKQFTIAKDDAIVHWDGDGVINYPISFNSFVIDRQGGDATGNGIVDDLVAITGGSDLFAFKFGDFISYWKSSGTSNSTLCGAKRDFSESPAFASGADCSDAPAAQAVSSTSSAATKTTTKATAKPQASASPKPAVDASKTTVRVDGERIFADGKASYRIVMVVRDSTGKVITSEKPVITTDDQNGVSISDTTLVGDEWLTNVTASVPGEKTVKVSVGGTDIKSLVLTFIDPTIPSAKPSPLIYVESANAEPIATGWNLAAIWTIYLVAAAGLSWLYKRKGWPMLGWRFVRKQPPSDT